jgi:hypothetical protein
MPDKNDTYSVEKRWSKKLAEKGWVPIPNDYLWKIHLLVDDKGNCPNPTQMLLIIMIISHKWSEELPYPSLRRLAKYLGLKERAIRTSLKNLEARGLIKIIKKKGSTSNRYDIKPLIDILEKTEDRGVIFENNGGEI